MVAASHSRRQPYFVVRMLIQWALIMHACFCKTCNEKPLAGITLQERGAGAERLGTWLPGSPSWARKELSRQLSWREDWKKPASKEAAQQQVGFLASSGVSSRIQTQRRSSKALPSALLLS